MNKFTAGIKSPSSFFSANPFYIFHFPFSEFLDTKTDSDKNSGNPINIIWKV